MTRLSNMDVKAQFESLLTGSINGVNDRGTLLY